VLFTSGTTATPKGVVLRHSYVLGHVLQTVDCRNTRTPVDRPIQELIAP
jgi:long-subunit acyl-CoA synthetase (AMP-forming)